MPLDVFGQLGSLVQVIDARLPATALLAAVISLSVRIIEWVACRGIKDECWRYTAMKVMRYTGLAVFLVSVISIWAQGLQGFLLIIGAAGAGLAIALAKEQIEIASPGLTLVRYPAERTWGEA